jgi:endonuclease I
MKKITLIMMLVISAITGFAQAPLPTSENFTGFTGTFSQPGWTYFNVTGTTYTYASGQVGVAGRLDATGEYIDVYVGGQMGNVTYYLKGQNSGGAWAGTFKVRESTNGSTWSDMATYTGTLSSTAFNLYTVTPAAASRYVRFEFTSKTSGNNVAIDEINIAAGVPANQDINVKYNTTSVLTGGTTPIFSSPVGTPTPVNFTVENLGLTALNVSNVTVTGPDAADYSITTSTAFAVGSQSNAALTLSFTPSSAGTRYATLTVSSDDPDEGTYVIDLYGVGGNLASEPAMGPSNLNFTSIKSYRANFSYISQFPMSDGFLVIRKTSPATITDAPVDGVSYMTGDAVGTSKVVYSGPYTGACLYSVIASTQYQLAVFSYNGNGTYTNYNTTSPLTGSFTSLGSMMPATEYNSISTAASTFLTDLSAHINPHTSVFYSNYDETMIRLFAARDTTGGQKVINCVYSNEAYLYTEPFTFAYMSREHTYCHNWMPTNPADGSAAAPNNVERPEYNDQHHLFPTNQNDVNAVRSNYPFGEVVTLQGTYYNFKFGADINGNYVVEPQDAHKGDAARAAFYMATCYNGKNDAFGVAQNWKFRNPISGSIPYGQDQNILKKWHYQDPPSSWEIARNDFLDSLQGNRNPFIDSMQYVCYIDFSTMTKIANPGIPCNTVGVQEKYKVNFDYSIFPNPAANEFSILLSANENSKYTLRITDLAGRLVHTQQLQVNNGMNYFAFDKLNLQSGAYMMEIMNGSSKLTKKLVVQ